MITGPPRATVAGTPSITARTTSPGFDNWYPQSYWTVAKGCVPSQFNTYFVTSTPDPETWSDSDIWSAAGLTTIVEH